MEHNHTLDYADRTKLNDGVKDPIGAEVEKGYAHKDIHRNLQGYKWGANHAALKAAGGSALTLQTVHNAGQKAQGSRPDPRIDDPKISWQKQLDTCYEDLQRLGECYVSEKLAAKRQVDGELSYAIAFAHWGMYCRRYSAARLAFSSSIFTLERPL